MRVPALHRFDRGREDWECCLTVGGGLLCAACWASCEAAPPKTSGREVSHFPVLKSSAIRRGEIDFAALNYLREDQSGTRSNFLCAGDVLITRLSGSVEYVGLCALVKEVPRVGLQYPDRLIRGHLPESFIWFGEFVVCYFQTSYVRTILEEAAKSTAGHKRISLSDLDKICIPVPPIAEVEEIVARVDEGLSRVKALEAEIRRSLKQAAAERQNILKFAFSGRLVPQDPTDEPACVLLDRIRAERAARPAKSSPRRRKTKATA